MERPLLKAEIREMMKKGAARKLRARGRIPAVFYSPRAKALSLVVDPRELSQALRTEAGENVLIDLEIGDGGQPDRKVVMIKDIQIDPLKRQILHADFYEVTMDAMVTVEIPIHLIGKAEGVKIGGILEQVRRTIQIQCLPGEIPKGIDVDVSALNIGDSIHVKDIQAEKLKIMADPGVTVATVVPPAAEEEKKVVEEVVAEGAEKVEAKAEEGEEKEKKEEKEKDKDKKEKKEEKEKKEK
jgi:large subunit ribosomal protein L25